MSFLNTEFNIVVFLVCINTFKFRKCKYFLKDVTLNSLLLNQALPATAIFIRQTLMLVGEIYSRYYVNGGP